MNLPSNLFLLISTSSHQKLKYILQSLIVSVFVDLKSFIKKRVTVCWTRRLNVVRSTSKIAEFSTGAEASDLA